MPVHASCVALDGRAALIRGSSGSGKSTLAVQMMALGADLVSDDRTCLEAEGDRLWATAPKALAGLIEMRGLGLALVPYIPRAEVILVIDLDLVDAARLPQLRKTVIKDLCIALIPGKNRPNLASEGIVLLGAAQQNLFLDPENGHNPAD